MKRYQIRDYPTLRKILWLDFLLGSSTGIGGLIFARVLAGMFGITNILMVLICIITLLYAVYAFWLVKRDAISIPLLRALVCANWIWTLISIGLLWRHYEDLTKHGLAFFILQILVVGGLAYLEGEQIIKLH